MARLPDGALVLAFKDRTSRTPSDLASVRRLTEQPGPPNRVIQAGGYAYTYHYLHLSEDGLIHVKYKDNYHSIRHERWMKRGSTKSLYNGTGAR
jgi:hypothetical protein